MDSSNAAANSNAPPVSWVLARHLAVLAVLLVVVVASIMLGRRGGAAACLMKAYDPEKQPLEMCRPQ